MESLRDHALEVWRFRKAVLASSVPGSVGSRLLRGVIAQPYITFAQIRLPAIEHMVSVFGHLPARNERDGKSTRRQKGSGM